MFEYWWSARKACIKLLAGQKNATSLPHSVPSSFRELRPWVHQGWEMVLLAAELVRPKSPLRLYGTKFFSANYDLHCQNALESWQWSPAQLQESLEDVRREAINHDLTNWLALHKPFSHVVERLQKLNSEGIALGVLTTKGADFTAQLLTAFQIKPSLLYGHESGSKTEVLLQLNKKRDLVGFVEDRLATLEQAISTNGLTSLNCYLASWGYLKPEDTQALPPGIHLLDPQTLATPLASWP